MVAVRLAFAIHFRCSPQKPAAQKKVGFEQNRLMHFASVLLSKFVMTFKYESVATIRRNDDIFGPSANDDDRYLKLQLHKRADLSQIYMLRQHYSERIQGWCSNTYVY